jgi:hypothetical protein
MWKVIKSMRELQATSVLSYLRERQTMINLPLTEVTLMVNSILALVLKMV